MNLRFPLPGQSCSMTPTVPRKHIDDVLSAHEAQLNIAFDSIFLPIYSIKKRMAFVICLG